MSREIKFRAWDKIDKEMLFPKWEEDYVGGGNRKIGLFIFRSKKYCASHSSLSWILKHPESFELELYSTKKDVADVEIYAGDIIEFEISKGHTHRQAIEFCDGNFNLPDARFFRVKVIGNIHENPELLT